MSGVPCSDVELERRTVAALISAPPSEVMAHPVSPGDLTDPLCRAVADCVLWLVADESDVTPVAIVEVAEQLGRDVGDLEGIFHLMGYVGGKLSVDAPRVAELARLREVYQAALGVASACQRLDTADAQTRILDLAERVQGRDDVGIMSALQVQKLAVKRLLVDARRTERVTTGLRGLDNIIGYLGAGCLGIVGADTGVGKTSTLLAMAEGQAAQSFRVGFVSVEDGPEVLGARLLNDAAGLGLSTMKLRCGKLTQDQFDAINRALTNAEDNGVYFAFEVGSTDADVCAAMARLVKAHGCQVVHVDYAQAINPSERGQSRKEDIRRIASRIKATAARLGVPVYLASQLTRPAADKRDKVRVPTKYDLKEAGDLENMAELIILLNRCSNEPNDDLYQRVDARIAKSKFGGDGWSFRFQRDGGRLVELDETGRPVGASWFNAEEW